MTIPRKGTRRIHLDGVAYRWRVHELMAPYGLEVVVQEEGGRGAVLKLRSSEDLAATHLKPSYVVTQMRRAQAVGWTPLQPGATIERDVSFDEPD